MKPIEAFETAAFVCVFLFLVLVYQVVAWLDGETP